MTKVELKALNHEIEIHLGGLKYSAIIKNKRFKAINFLKKAFQEKQFFILLKIFLRSLQLGWYMPLLFILKKMPFWNEFVFFQLNHWGKAICKITRVKLHIINRENVSNKKTHLFASNHLSLLDIPVLSAAIPVIITLKLFPIKPIEYCLGSIPHKGVIDFNSSSSAILFILVF